MSSESNNGVSCFFNIGARIAGLSCSWTFSAVRTSRKFKFTSLRRLKTSDSDSESLRPMGSGENVPHVNFISTYYVVYITGMKSLTVLLVLVVLLVPVVAARILDQLELEPLNVSVILTSTSWQLERNCSCKGRKQKFSRALVHTHERR